MADDMAAWPAAAGPLANMVLGALLFLGLWGLRGPHLVPLMLWGPIALLQEWTTALVQLGTGEAGTDWVLINDAGMSAGVIIGLAVVGLIAGLAGLYLLLPAAGVSPEMPLVARLGTLLLGMAGFTAVILGVSLVLNDSNVDISRNLRLTVFGVLIAILLAATSPAFTQIRRAKVMDVSLSAVWISLALGFAVLVLFLVV